MRRGVIFILLLYMASGCTSAPENQEAQSPHEHMGQPSTCELPAGAFNTGASKAQAHSIHAINQNDSKNRWSVYADVKESL